MNVGSGEVLQAAFASLWRRKLLVLWIVATAVVLGISAVVVMPARYTAEAYIRGQFLTSDTVNKEDKSMSTGSMSLDPVRVIETQSRLLQSHQVALRVVQTLGLERLQPVVSKRRWLPAAFSGSAAKTPGDQEDIAATRLLSGLSVTSDPRAYLIMVRCSARDPELAVLITNAFVAELLRSTRLQTLSLQRFSEEATLSKQRAKFGDKHPKVAEARMVLATTDDLLKDQLNEVPDAILQAAGENVTKATAATSTRSPNPPFLIGLFLFVGLVVGIAVALWLEQSRRTETFSCYVRPFA